MIYNIYKTRYQKSQSASYYANKEYVDKNLQKQSGLNVCQKQNILKF